MSEIIGSRNLHTGCDKRTVATDQQRHEGQEYSSPRAHCKCNGPGTFCVSVSVSVLILAMIQDQALVAAKRSKHYLVETKGKSQGHKQVVGLFKIHISFTNSHCIVLYSYSFVHFIDLQQFQKHGDYGDSPPHPRWPTPSGPPPSYIPPLGPIMEMEESQVLRLKWILK